MFYFDEGFCKLLLFWQVTSSRDSKIILSKDSFNVGISLFVFHRMGPTRSDQATVERNILRVLGMVQFVKVACQSKARNLLGVQGWFVLLGLVVYF